MSDTLDPRRSRVDRTVTAQVMQGQVVTRRCNAAASVHHVTRGGDATVSDTSSDTTPSASLLISAKWTQLAIYLEKSEA